MLQIVIRKIDCKWRWGRGINKCCLNLEKRKSMMAGFTLLELLVVIGIIAIFASLATTPDLEYANAKASFNNTKEILEGELANIRQEAMVRNTTTRLVLVKNGNAYTIRTARSATPTSTCSSTTVDLPIAEKPLAVHARYRVTPVDAPSQICFFRNGTSSGVIFTISPIISSDEDRAQNLKTATIEAIIATGYIDVNVH